ncbi:MAG: TnpV protein [Defluviitaleaceae bacterium]|nr:TnpV protein [Defluviitaleaceae bacterium]
MQNTAEITYTWNGDYLIPDIGIPPEVENLRSLTKYGMMHKSYLKERRGIIYTDMALSGELYPHCLMREEQAEERLTVIMQQMTTKNPPPDKAADPMAWVAHMNALKAQAEEVILTELIYAYP